MDPSSSSEDDNPDQRAGPSGDPFTTILHRSISTYNDQMAKSRADLAKTQEENLDLKRARDEALQQNKTLKAEVGSEKARANRALASSQFFSAEVDRLKKLKDPRPAVLPTPNASSSGSQYPPASTPGEDIKPDTVEIMRDQLRSQREANKVERAERDKLAEAVTKLDKELIEKTTMLQKEASVLQLAIVDLKAQLQRYERMVPMVVDDD